MAKYGDYTPDVMGHFDNHINYFLFPPEFSQSRLGDRLIGSNACTLIAILLGGRINEFNIKIYGDLRYPLSRNLVTALAEAILEGNEVHESLAITGEMTNVNLTVPEAIQAVSYKYPQLTEWIERTRIYTRSIKSSLAAHIMLALNAWIQQPPRDKNPNSDLFITLIADTRSVLFVFQTDIGKATIVDSHSHSFCGAGAVVIQSYTNYLQELCEWFCDFCHHSFGMSPHLNLFELSCLYFKNSP